MKTYAIIVAILKFNDKILILKRNSKKRFDPNKWEPVSGFIKEHETAEDTVFREVAEETGLKCNLLRSGKSFEVIDEWRWIIMPFLVSVDSEKVKIDHQEHSEYKWILPKDINKFDCVKDIEKDLESVGIKVT